MFNQLRKRSICLHLAVALTKRWTFLCSLAEIICGGFRVRRFSACECVNSLFDICYLLPLFWFFPSSWNRSFFRILPKLLTNNFKWSPLIIAVSKFPSLWSCKLLRKLLTRKPGLVLRSSGSTVFGLFQKCMLIAVGNRICIRPCESWKLSSFFLVKYRRKAGERSNKLLEGTIKVFPIIFLEAKEKFSFVNIQREELIRSTSLKGNKRVALSSFTKLAYSIENVLSKRRRFAL